MQNPIIQVIDDEKGFLWRLKLGEEVSKWFSHYSGILTHQFNDGRKFLVITQYFENDLLPELTPILIIPRKKQRPKLIKRKETDTVKARAYKGE